MQPGMAMSKCASLSIKPDSHHASSSSSQPQLPQDPMPLASTSPKPSSSAIKATSARRNSLRLANHPPNIPIPPSLLHSPYINTPKAHKEPATTTPTPATHVPSEEEDYWLQDTVPLPSGSRTNLPPPNHTRSMITHQSPPLTPPVRPTSVLTGSGNTALSPIGDYRLQQAGPSTLDYPYPFPSPSAAHTLRKSANYTGRPPLPGRSEQRHTISGLPVTAGYFTDYNSVQ
ncbi:hypothetical protein DFP72DRAFT_1058673 [Ephemerocybe angulata]|uniref:Uncharacterized protein n=1 Tax=Ephemerocybe angulata TaxID=980116 RepID=A0A8H6IIL0_9AGAR|nr:hypothetical protein DFP72DRAFT_1058673 [Tulosesus angulatus]